MQAPKRKIEAAWIKRGLALLLAVAVAAALLPGTAFAAEPDLPEWNFLFVVFKNVDADYTDQNGVTAHTAYAMTEEEIDTVRENAGSFLAYMNRVGVMNAHVYISVIDRPVTELSASEYGPYLSPEDAAPLLAGADLDKYDHVFCNVSLNVATTYSGLTGAPFGNGTGESCINLRNREYAEWLYGSYYGLCREAIYVHEFLHFAEQLDQKWGERFALHDIIANFYTPDEYDYRACYTDILLDRVDGNAGLGTGVAPAVWQYPPHALRTVSELTIPEGVTAIGDYAFQNLAGLKKVTVPGSVATIGMAAFSGCVSLESVAISDGVTGIGRSAFDGCVSLKRVDLPGSLTSIGYAAFYGCVSLESVSIPDSVTSMDEWAFGYCGSLKSVVLPAGLTSIEGAVFYDCESLYSVVIPGGVTGIGQFAFRGCAKLKDVYYGGSEEQWNRVSVGDVNSWLLSAEKHYNSGGPSFTDVPPGEWYAAAAGWGAARGFILGNGDGTFAPEDTCTHIHILTFLWRADGRRSAPRSPITMDLTDYQGAVDWAYDKGMITGGFDPDAPCTRADAVKYIWQAFGSESAPASSFPDVADGEGFAAAVNWAVANGVTAGYEDGTFRPGAVCTRGHIVTFLHRAYAPEARVNG